MYDFKNKMPDRTVIYKTVSGLKLPMDIYLPPNKKEKYNAVLCIHGGGWKDGITPNSHWNGGWMKYNARYFASKGYVGIAISYRSLNNANVNIHDLIKDCEDAMLYIRDNLKFIDYESIIVMGDSAGGHLASMIGVSQIDEIRPYEVVACNPVLDCMRDKWSYAFCNAEDAKSVSLLQKFPKKCAKFLFLHGSDDDVVEIEDTIAFNKKLICLGHTSHFIEVPTAKHAFILYDYEYSDKFVTNIMNDIYRYIKREA